jgi:cytochrome b561
MATLFLAIIPLGLIAADIGPNNPDKELYHYREVVLSWHKGLGVLVLALAMVRLSWLVISYRPPLPTKLSPTERLLARVVHLALYALMFAMPLSGIYLSQAAGFEVDFFGIFSVPQFVFPDTSLPFPQRPEIALGTLLHKQWIWYALAGALTFHIVGLLKHLIFDRDATVWKRMGGRRASPNEV